MVVAVTGEFSGLLEIAAAKFGACEAVGVSAARMVGRRRFTVDGDCSDGVGAN